MSTDRPSLAVFKLASCDGCQLRLLDCEDELFAIGERVKIAHFLEASSAVAEGPYDLALVEGSITSAVDLERIRSIRAQSKKLVTIGACATSGGIQALRNMHDHGEMVRAVYAHPELLDSLATSTPVSAHVPVDFELHGCPIDKGQLLEVIKAMLFGRKPTIPTHSLCLECKMAGNTCVMVAAPREDGDTQRFCLGPITHGGCGAICPTYGRGCYGCFGPSDAARPDVLASELRRRGATAVQISRLLSTFNAAAPAFHEEAKKHGG